MGRRCTTEVQELYGYDVSEAGIKRIQRVDDALGNQAKILQYDS